VAGLQDWDYKGSSWRPVEEEHLLISCQAPRAVTLEAGSVASIVRPSREKTIAPQTAAVAASAGVREACAVQGSQPSMSTRCCPGASQPGALQ
jgi:hypothetical protein